MLSRQLVKAAFKWFAKAEIFRRDRQDFTALFVQCIEHPIGEGDFNGLHTTFTALLDGLCAVDEAEDFPLLNAACGDVGFDAG